MIRPLIALLNAPTYRLPYVHGFRTPTHYSCRDPYAINFIP
jgi:hypothetical protein